MCIKPRTRRDAGDLAALAALTNIGGVAVEVNDDDWGFVRRVFEDAGLTVLRRVTIEVRKAGDVPRVASEARKKGYDIVAVLPLSDEAARYAARDERVDLVVVRPGMARLVDSSQAGLHRMGGGAVELQVTPLLSQKQGFRTLMVVSRRAVAYSVPLVVSSCATTMWEFIPPRSIEALLSALGVPENYAKAFTYSHPWSIARRRMRRD
ncbi:RNase P subunit p30 [Pyrolobus fumarii 1A]|uniref:Ribonuclease P protein component 3 n=2 Tax=Pyrolobus fumarii TaxID=54252 RepID=G0EDS6_PYRF1|nr:RNase P subunit p30 [Pyrolobus fumarii 1A]